jgi:HAD superfamily hydrolase (TIGR01490 family)
MNLALFDFDGTITSTDTFTPFIHFATPRYRLVPGMVLLSPLILGYELGLMPATRLRAAAAYLGFKGRRADDLNELGSRYSKTLAGQMRSEALAKIRWHQAQGDEVVVVSASLQPYLQGFCEEHEVGLICTQLEHVGGVLTGRYTSGDCTGSEKARRVRAAYDLSRYPVIYAYGDTAEDRELLGLASRRFFRWRELDAS